jgi:parallel beta-helix repeat protein
MGGATLRRKIPSIAICMILILSSFIVFSFSFGIIDVAHGEVLYVNETGSNGAYVTIQDAIDNASDGDTVFVFNGTYYENVVVNKTINLTGEDRFNTIIDGESIDAVRITSDWVNISGFKLVSAASFWAGIKLDNIRKCKVFNNFAYGNGRSGIYLNNSSENFISDNIAIASHYYGIYLRYSDRNNISNNTVSSNSFGGVRLDFSNENNISDNIANFCLQFSFLLVSSNGNNLTSNTMSSGDQNHIKIESSNDNNISYNTVTSCNANGIFLKSSIGNYIAYNNVSNNGRGIEIASSSGNKIIENNVSSNRWDGIYLHGGIMENHIESNNVSKNGNGIKIKKSREDIISGNILMNNGYGIYLEDSIGIKINYNKMINDGIVLFGYFIEHWNTHDIDISNTVNGKPVYYWRNKTQDSIPPGAGQVILANCTNITVESQEITHVEVGIELGFSLNNNVTRNNVSSNYWCGIFLWESDENNVNENIACNNSSGFDIWYSNGNDISENIVSKNKKGMYIIYSNRNIITNNSAYQNENGLYLHTSSDNIIRRNNASSNNETGILLFECDWSNITDNFVSQNNKSGIFIYYSENSVINENNILNNTLGFWFFRGKHNIVYCNTILSNSDYGLYLEYSSNNTFYFNNIISNTVQAYDDRHDNFWDSGYPIGGNYWSDYNGNDNFKGPFQDQPGSDGIGDINYTIDPDSVDNYPLIEPYIDRALVNYTILNPGWNLISLPLIQQDQNLQKVLEMIDGYYDAVQWYDPTNPIDPWKHHSVGKPFGNDLYEINETMGFWIHITNPGDTIFLYNGTQPTENQTISLNKGWNLVGYPSLTNCNRTVGLNNLLFGMDVDAIWSYDSVNQNWEESDESDNIKIGKGYWIHAKADCVWEVPL